MLISRVAIRRALPALVLLTAGFGRATLASAQTATAPATATAATPQDPNSPAPSPVVTLNPYEVNGSQDRGYYGANTLSGTRISSSVQDLGASITVVTKQQLLDTAAVDINDIFKYEAGVEGIYDYTAQNSSSPTTDVLQGGVATATRVRGLNAPNISIGNFASTPRIPIDTYNIDSVEISRGPNSTLFGLGDPSGSININQSQALLTRDTNQVEFRVDSDGGWRSSVNFNRPILKDKLAVRIALLYANNAYRQKPSEDLTRRLFATLTFHPFPDTVIRGSYEHFRENAQRPNYLTPRDAVSDWVNFGRPTWNPLNFTVTVNGRQSAPIPVGSGATAESNVLGALGIATDSTAYTRAPMYYDQGQMQFWEIARLDTGANANTGSTSNVRLVGGSGTPITLQNPGGIQWQALGITNKGLYDYTKINAVSEDWNYDHASLYTVVVEQKLLPNLYFRGGWFLADSNSWSRNIVNPPTLRIDVNQYLIDGQANPYFLRPVVTINQPTITKTPEYNDNLQAQLAYDLDLKTEAKGIWKYFGHHRFLTYYESRHVTNGTYRFYEEIVDPNHPWITPTNLNYVAPAVDRGTYRFYVGGPGALGYQPGYAAPKVGTAGKFKFLYNNATNNTWVSDPTTIGLGEYTSSQARQEITSRGVVLQSTLFDRIVYTGGLRKDFKRNRASNGAVDDPLTGVYDNGPLSTWQAWSSDRGVTRTNSVVVRPLPWIGLSWDKSDSFQPQTPAVDVAGNFLPDSYGYSKDVGGFVNLFDDKLVLGVKFYKTDIVNSRAGSAALGSRIARLEDGNNHTVGETENLYDWALNNVIIPRMGGPGVANPADPAVIAAVRAFIQLPAGYVSAEHSGLPFAGVANTEAKGAELDLTYNPFRNWNIKITATKTEALNTSLENSVGDYIAQRLPLWTTIKDDQGNLWWNQSIGGTIPSSFFYGVISAPLEIDRAGLGKSDPQVKKYMFRGLTTYNFITGPLQGFSVGGAVRWDDKSVLGYGASAPDSDGIIRSLSPDKAYYDPARTSYECWFGYRFKLDRGQITCIVQLNVQNPLQHFSLRPTAVNPDGVPYNYRIIYPQKTICSTTFEF